MVITGKHVAAARGLVGMTQGDLAEASGIARKTIIEWESGIRAPRAETIDRVREAFERRGVEFLNGGSPGVRLHGDRSVIPV